jgi:hypothetical protein
MGQEPGGDPGHAIGPLAAGDLSGRLRAPNRTGPATLAGGPALFQWWRFLVRSTATRAATIHARTAAAINLQAGTPSPPSM